MNVSLFIPCFVDQMTPQVGLAVVQVLERLGHRVDRQPHLRGHLVDEAWDKEADVHAQIGRASCRERVY